MKPRTHQLIEGLPTDDREAIELALLEAHYEGLPRSAIGNFFVAVISTFPLIGRLPTTPVLLLFLLILGSALGLLWFWFKYRRNRRASIAHLTASATLASALISLSWAVVVQYYFSHGNDVVRGLVSMMAAGLMAASVIACYTVPRTGIVFISILGGSIVVAQARVNTIEYWISFALSCVFIAILISSLLETYKIEFRKLEKEKELRKSADTVRLLLNDYEEQSSDWLWRTDSCGRILTPSRRFRESSAGRIRAGMPLASLFDERPETDQLRNALTEGRPIRNLIVQFHHENSVRWWRISGRALHSEAGEYWGMEGFASDITEARQAEARINYMAHHDALTGLPNRFLLNENLEAMLSISESAPAISLLYLDLDHFKVINDTLGHSIGDRVLQKVGQLLQEQLHAGDLVARLGGDEFAILLDPGSPSDRVQAVSEKIVSVLGEPLQIDEHQIFTGTSVGIATAPQDANTPEELLRNADLALYNAKASGRGQTAHFAPEMHQRMLERQSLETDLRLAIANGELELHYQPLIEIASTKIVGYEALLRWNHPQRGMIMPDQFIPIAEDNGFIIQLGEWVLRKGLDEAAHWPKHLKVAINVSPLQLRNKGFAMATKNALAATGLDAQRLEVEVTETVLLDASPEGLEMLHELRKLGVRIALDDFGTGFSSLHYLRSFPFDRIKIDRSFVARLESDPDSQAIVRAVVSLADAFGMETTAEGVEMPEQLRRLSDEGVTQVQGFLYSPAKLAEQFENLR
ncbi:putative bifunctional diguanylate cyclase/phosphodiesterase [Qipengyuania sp.]|uniref:putative bifunctional diguanylate cyclase/phosphodiesterase n=1 Tax=Qipengyuania sp. TaxID=2004515 RepID=UPI003AF95EEA